MEQWKTLSRTTILDHSKYLRVESHRVELPNGTIIPDWPWVVSPDYIQVVPVTPQGTILCFRQTKYAVEGVSYAPIGGYIDPGEDPLPAAKRELHEEMGCEAGEWIDLGTYASSGNHGGGKAYCYLALGTRKVAQPHRDDLEEMEIVELTPAEAETKLLRHEFKVATWSAVIGLALLHMKARLR